MAISEYLAFAGCQCVRVLLNGFANDLTEDEKIDSDIDCDVTHQHFCPVNRWEVDRPGNRLLDMTAGHGYDLEEPNAVRIKCTAVFFATIPLQTLGLLLNLMNRIGKVVTFAHFWHPNKKCTFKARLIEMSMDILRIVLTPLILVGMLLAALVGATISPFNGRKIYASLERWSYQGKNFLHEEYRPSLTSLFAFSFHPDSKTHFQPARAH